MDIIQTFETKKIVTKIIHLSDIHIRTGNSLYCRYLEYLDVIKKLIISLKKHDYDNTIVIITGDIFHHKNLIESYGIDLFNELIINLTKLTTVYLIRGNHDYRQDYSPSVMDDINIELISSLISKYTNVHYLNETGLYEIGDILVGLVTIQDTLKTGDTSGKVDKLPDFPWTEKKYKHTVALYHGIVVSNEKTIYKDPIKIEWINNYDFGLLGDIHKQQIYNSSWNNDGYYEIKNKDELMWGYSGSLIQQNFGESINKHGYLLWDLDNYKVYSEDIENKTIYCNLYYKNDKWITKIIDNKFKECFINFNEYLNNNQHIKNINIQIKNNENESYKITEILKSKNVKCLIMSNKIINDTMNNDDKTNQFKSNTIQEYTSLETWYEFVEKNITLENKDVLDKFNWKNIIKNPDSLLIDTGDIPESIIEKVNKKNKTITNNIGQYITARDEITSSNLLELKYITWDWVLCYKNDCYFNFENMDKNVMLLNAENGFGKSSFLEIICFGLFGTSIPSRHNKQFSSSIICNKKPKGVSSKIMTIFKLNNKEYMLLRMFGYKSNDVNKLDQKVELYHINKTGGSDNLVSLHSGATAVNDWINIYIGNSKTFFQSCMHTQNSDNDLFSMSYNDQRNLMDKSLSLQSINILMNIFKESKASYTTIISHISTLNTDAKMNHEIVDEEELNILLNECNNLNVEIDTIDNKISSNKFPSEIKESDLNLDESIISEKIVKLKKDTKDKEFKNISDILKYYGQLSSVINQYKGNFKYYNIDINNGDNRISDSESLLWNDICSNIREICERVLSTEILKLTDIESEKKLIENYFINIDNNNYESININEIEELRELKEVKNKKLQLLTNTSKDILFRKSEIIITISKDEVSQKLEKYEKMKTNYKKKKQLLHNNKLCLKFFETKLSEINEIIKDIKYTTIQIKKINESEYPFNPECECCKKQPWKIQLCELENNLKNLQISKLNSEKEIKEKEKELNQDQEKIIKNIEKLEKWFLNYEELKTNEFSYNKQLKLIIKKENLEKEYQENDINSNKLNTDIKIIEEKLNDINLKLVHQSWIERKTNNANDLVNYNIFKTKLLEEWDVIIHYYNYLNKIINDNDENTKNLELLIYWNKILNIKPHWELINNLKSGLKSKRRYYQNITNKYISLKKSYEIYIEDCKKMERYEKILTILKDKLEGVEILSEMFNNFRLWLYKEKLFPLILNKINTIIENMSKDDELLQLDIVWSGEVFNWFIIHNDNKIVINKASGYQKFIIDLGMRITLSSIGVSSLKCNQLFIDEGFSSCDQDHLSKIPLFLNSLLNVYSSILVVSHIQDIKNCSSTSYDIERDNNLSLIKYGGFKNNHLNEILKKIKQNS
tara:strand:- start:5397 stop:9479 length:4083 start_codon:yes stop_codon:yes gene_type:complete